MAMATFHVLGIPGSLREASYNLALLRAARDLAPERMTIEIWRPNDVPLYNEDVEKQGDPPAVKELKHKIAEADGLLLATPEYNHSVSGVMKNVIDWASRKPNPLKGKPVALMGASPSPTGTARAQDAVRHCLANPQAFVLPKPETLVFGAAGKFDDSGNLTDETTRKILVQELEALREFALTVDERARRRFGDVIHLDERARAERRRAG